MALVSGTSGKPRRFESCRYHLIFLFFFLTLKVRFENEALGSKVKKKKNVFLC